MGKNNQKTKEEFIENAIKIYGEEYDYSLIDYVNCKDVLKIICKTHGIFEVTGDVFLNKGKGCSRCKEDVRRIENKNNFIDKSHELYGNTYNYSLVNYINNNTKVEIICSVHGVFEQRPMSHLKGGCYKCGRMKTKHNTLDFIKDSIKTHGDLYDYSQSNYIDADTDLDIICSKHGKFSQNPVRHKRGAGCKKCSVDKKSKDYRYTTEQFTEKSTLVHGNKYDYNLVDYIQSKKPVKIICSTHGIFEQKPYQHLLGKGCKDCANLINVYKRADYIKLSEKAILYLIKVFNDQEVFYKIGKTKDSIKKRFSSTNIKPYNYEIVYSYLAESGIIFDLEIELHKKYNSYKYKPLNKFSGHSECYTLELPIEEIKNV